MLTGLLPMGAAALRGDRPAGNSGRGGQRGAAPGLHDWEYPLWVLLGPRVQIQHVGVGNESAKLTPTPPDPTIVICTDARRVRLSTPTPAGSGR